jgi:hypothetical protein
MYRRAGFPGRNSIGKWSISSFRRSEHAVPIRICQSFSRIFLGVDVPFSFFFDLSLHGAALEIGTGQI